jgi:uncharacterized protein
LLDVVGRDLEVLQDAGVDAVLFCNEADIPYQLEVGPEIPTAMAAVIGELQPSIRVPFGINVLWDARASLAVAHATGATFIREVLTGVYESDIGMIAPALGEVAAYREAIGAGDVALFGNITPEFSSSIGTRSVAERAKSASFLGLDAILISGPEAGVPFAMSDLRAAKAVIPHTAVLANTGVQAGRLGEILAVADGVIVGTSLKVDGVTWNPVDPGRAGISWRQPGAFVPASPADWPAVGAVILDMDGLPIDTEPAWRAAEASVFAAFGVQLSAADLVETTGQAIGEVVAAWRQRQAQRGGEIDHLSDTEIADRITDVVIARVKEEGQPMAGVPAAITMFRRQRLGLAIASSSPMRLIDAVCERLGLGWIQVRCSAFDETNGKPAPDVYLTAARRLGESPVRCLAIEDSPIGVLAAKSAGMRCLAVPDPLLAADPRFRAADLVLSSLDCFDDEALQVLGFSAAHPTARVADRGEADDRRVSRPGRCAGRPGPRSTSR